MRIRTLLAIGVFVLALVLAAVPAVGTAVPVTEPFVAVLGLCLIFAGIVIATERTEQSQPEPPVPEVVASFPYPGADIDEMLTTLREETDSPARKRARTTVESNLRNRLRRLAKNRIQEQYNLTAERATTAIETGVWTTDPHAQAFFGRSFASLGFTTRVRRLLTRNSLAITVQVHRTISAIEDLDTPGTASAPTREALLEMLDTHAGTPGDETNTTRENNK